MWEDTNLNVLIGTLSDDLVVAIFGPVEPERVPADWNMVNVLVLAAIFPSKSQARKNFKGPLDIPFGSHLFTLGKKKLKVFVHRAVTED